MPQQPPNSQLATRKARPFFLIFCVFSIVLGTSVALKRPLSSPRFWKAFQLAFLLFASLLAAPYSILAAANRCALYTLLISSQISQMLPHLFFAYLSAPAACRSVLPRRLAIQSNPVAFCDMTYISPWVRWSSRTCPIGWLFWNH